MEPASTELVLPARICGVYLLTCRGKVVYVGQSCNVVGRVQLHRDAKEIGFDGVRFIPCDEDRLGHLEGEMIRKYQPEHNKTDSTPCFRHVLTGPRACDLAYSIVAGAEFISFRALVRRVEVESGMRIDKAYFGRCLDRDPRFRWVAADAVYTLSEK